MCELYKRQYVLLLANSFGVKACRYWFQLEMKSWTMLEHQILTEKLKYEASCRLVHLFTAALSLTADKKSHRGFTL